MNGFMRFDLVSYGLTIRFSWANIVDWYTKNHPDALMGYIYIHITPNVSKHIAGLSHKWGMPPMHGNFTKKAIRNRGHFVLWWAGRARSQWALRDRNCDCKMSHGMSDRMSDRMADRMAEEMSNRMPDRMSERMSDRIMPESMWERMSESMPDRMPDRKSEHVSDRLNARKNVRMDAR